MSSNEATWEFRPYTKTIHRSSYPAIDPTNPANSAKGKVVVVTGGGSGIGKAIASAFVKAGAKTVAILGRRENILADAKAELSKLGSSEILTFKADIVDAEALKSAFAETASKSGPIDIVVGNAGFLPTLGSVADSDIDDWFKGFEVNIKGTALTFRAWLPHRSTNSPTFISINSGIAHGDAYPNFSGYGASKAGQASLIQYFQSENPDLRVVSLHPGVIESEMNAKSGMPLSKDDASLPSSFAVWLASPAASWLGGRFVWSHWDVDELLQMKDEILANNELVIGLTGHPKDVELKIMN